MGEFSAWHWLIIVVAFLVLFGAAKLPIFAKSLGESMRIFKKELRNDETSTAAPVLPASGQANTGATAASAAPVETTETR